LPCVDLDIPIMVKRNIAAIIVTVGVLLGAIGLVAVTQGIQPRGLQMEAARSSLEPFHVWLRNCACRTSYPNRGLVVSRRQQASFLCCCIESGRLGSRHTPGFRMTGPHPRCPKKGTTARDIFIRKSPWEYIVMVGAEVQQLYAECLTTPQKYVFFFILAWRVCP
jgi:hypothetical protein